jgi:hypothetical protein
LRITPQNFSKGDRLVKILGLIIAGALAAISQQAAASVVFMQSNTPQIMLQDWGVARQMTARSDPFSAGPVGFGSGVTYSASSANSVIGATGAYSFGSNGSWKGTPMAGLNTAQGSMTFDFTTPVSSVMAELNWDPNHSDGQLIYIAIYNSFGDLLETFQLADGDAGLDSAFYGFTRGTADISRMVLSNGYIGARNFYTNTQANYGGGYNGPFNNLVEDGPHGEHNLQAAVPEPGTWLLMIVGFGACGAMLRRSRQLTLAPIRA